MSLNNLTKKYQTTEWETKKLTEGSANNLTRATMSAEAYGSMTRATKRGFKEDFLEIFLEDVNPTDEVVEKNKKIKQPQNKKYHHNKKLAEGQEDCFTDIGFEWAGHQKYSMWDCRFNEINEDGFGRKTIYFHDLDMAKEMAIKYGANTITLTEQGFSLRWGTKVINNPSHDPKKKKCGATGMGVWVNEKIDIGKMKKHAEDGAKVSDALKSAVLKDCLGFNDGLGAEKKERAEAEAEAWLWGGAWANKQHSGNWKEMEEREKAKKAKTTKKADKTEKEFKKKMRADAKAHGARVEKLSESEVDTEDDMEEPPKPVEKPKKKIMKKKKRTFKVNGKVYTPKE